MAEPSDILHFPLCDTYTVEQALAAAGQRDLERVLVLGITDSGELFVTSSRMTRAEALWIAQLGCRNALGEI